MCVQEVTQLTRAMMLTGVLGLGVAAPSYRGSLRVSLTSDPRLLPDVERLRDYVADVFRELLPEASARSTTFTKS